MFKESLIKPISAKVKAEFNQGDYKRMSKPQEYSWMTKDKLMTYTFFALLILTIITAAMWSMETTPSGCIPESN